MPPLVLQLRLQLLGQLLLAHLIQLLRGEDGPVLSILPDLFPPILANDPEVPFFLILCLLLVRVPPLVLQLLGQLLLHQALGPLQLVQIRGRWLVLAGRGR